MSSEPRRHRYVQVDPLRREKIMLLVGLLVLAVLATFLFLEPVQQDPAYHEFVDQRKILGVPNFWNVITNLAFVPIGIVGLWRFSAGVPAGGLESQATAYRVFFAGVILIGVGSALYHYYPGNLSLVWDRLPMTISFMAFVAAIIGEQIDERFGRLLLWPLVLTGLLSVGYWYYMEYMGAGDLRLYALVQFAPLLLLPLALVLFRSPFRSNKWIWITMLAYGAAKIAELYDQALFELLGFSGHSLKHLLAALGAFALLLALIKRVPRSRQTYAR